MRRTRSYAKFLAFALAVSLAFQSVPASAATYLPGNDTSNGAPRGTVGDNDTSSIALGDGAKTTLDAAMDGGNKFAIALGENATATGMFSIAEGSNAQATAGNAMAFGSGAKATADFALAAGAYARATNTDAMAFGQSANAAGVQAIAVGKWATAAAENALAAGYNAKARGADATAVGKQAIAEGDGSLAAGSEASAGGAYSVAAGFQSSAAGENAIAVGKWAAAAENALAAGFNAKAQAENALAAGYNAKAQGVYAAAIGANAEATAESSIAIGNGSNASRDNATAIGTGAEASGLGTVVIGDGAKANGNYSIAIGHDGGVGDGVRTTGLNAIAIGTDTVATGANSVAIGSAAKARSDSSLALGYGAEAKGKNSVALGIEAYSTENNSVALGRNSLANEENVVSIGNDAAKITRRLVNMAAGRTDYEAVNVAQLNSALDIFGTDIAEVNTTDGTITKNGFTYRTNAQATVQDAFVAIGADIDELDANAVRYTSRTGAEVLSLVGDGTNIAVSNVADGDVTETSTYAVNGSQFYSLAESIAGELGVTYSGDTMIGDFSVDINGRTYDNVAAAIGALANGALANGWNINGATGTPGTGGTPGAGTGEGSGSSSVASGGSLNVEAGSNIEVTVEGGTTPGDADLNISVSDTPTFESVTAGSMEADTITANKSVTVGTGDKQTVIDGNAGTVTVGTGDNQTKIDGTTGTVTVGDSNSNKYTEIGSGKLHVHTNIGGVNGGVLANDIGLQVYNEKGDQVWINNEGTVYIAKGNGNSVTLTNGTGKFTNDKGTTEIDGGNVEVSNQITVGGADGTVINNGSVSINNNSAYFRENAMKVGSMTYDGVSNTLNMGGAGRLTGLADGGVYMGSTDAVTGNQLWQAYKRMDQLQESINIVGAHAAALSGLHPIDYNPYEPTTLSAAIGTYRDEYAVAVGVFHYVRENVLFNLGASICSDGDLMGRAGISFTVGRGGDKKKALAPKDMNEVQAQLAEVRQALHELKAENAALKVRLDAKSK